MIYDFDYSPGYIHKWAFYGVIDFNLPLEKQHWHVFHEKLLVIEYPKGYWLSVDWLPEGDVENGEFHIKVWNDTDIDENYYLYYANSRDLIILQGKVIEFHKEILKLLK